MKTYTHDYTLPAEAEEKLHEAFCRCQDSEVKQLLEGTQNLLHKYLSGDNLIEDDGVADGLVRQHDAEAAVKEAENKRKDLLDLMVTLAKDTLRQELLMPRDHTSMSAIIRNWPIVLLPGSFGVQTYSRFPGRNHTVSSGCL